MKKEDIISLCSSCQEKAYHEVARKELFDEFPPVDGAKFKPEPIYLCDPCSSKITSKERAERRAKQNEADMAINKKITEYAAALDREDHVDQSIRWAKEKGRLAADLKALQDYKRKKDQEISIKRSLDHTEEMLHQLKRYTDHKRANNLKALDAWMKDQVINNYPYK